MPSYSMRYLRCRLSRYALNVIRYAIDKSTRTRSVHIMCMYTSVGSSMGVMRVRIFPDSDIIADKRRHQRAYSTVRQQWKRYFIIFKCTRIRVRITIDSLNFWYACVVRDIKFRFPRCLYKVHASSRVRRETSSERLLICWLAIQMATLF
jgi:hypothetical protein